MSPVFSIMSPVFSISMRAFIVSLLSALALPLLTSGAESSADVSWAAYEAAYDAWPVVVSGTEASLGVQRQLELRALKVRELGLAFIAAHPADPRRWIVVHRFSPNSPLFVKDWGPLNAEGLVERPVVDVSLASEWKARVAALKAEMEQASDLPQEIQASLAQARTVRMREESFRRRWQGDAKELAPDFAVPDVSGAEVKLSDYRGKIVVLDFWATWCSPCIDSMPHSQEIAERYRDQEVVVLAVCVWDERSKFDAWLNANRARYSAIHWAFDPAGADAPESSTKRYDVGAIPCQFVIDREGRVVQVVIGFSPQQDRLEKALAKAGVKIDSTAPGVPPKAPGA